MPQPTFSSLFNRPTIPPFHSLTASRHSLTFRRHIPCPINFCKYHQSASVNRPIVYRTVPLVPSYSARDTESVDTLYKTFSYDIWFSTLLLPELPSCYSFLLSLFSLSCTSLYFRNSNTIHFFSKHFRRTESIIRNQSSSYLRK